MLKTTDFLNPLISSVVAYEDVSSPRRSRPMAPLKIKEPKFAFEDVAITFKNFARYSSFIIYPSDTFLVQKPTAFKYSTSDYVILLFTLFGTMLFIKKTESNKKPIQLMGLLFFIVSIIPFCGFFYVPIFYYSNFVDYWLSVPLLGIILMLSQMQYRKIVSSIFVITLVLFFARTAYIASKNIDPVEILTAASMNVPENPIVRLILAKHYFYKEIFSKSNIILLNVKKNYNLEVEMLSRDIEINIKAMNGEEFDTSTL